MGNAQADAHAIVRVSVKGFAGMSAVYERLNQAGTGSERAGGFVPPALRLSDRSYFDSVFSAQGLPLQLLLVLQPPLPEQEFFPLVAPQPP